jgi:hypothetical protein
LPRRLRAKPSFCCAHGGLPQLASVSWVGVKQIQGDFVHDNLSCNPLPRQFRRQYYGGGRLELRPVSNETNIAAAIIGISPWCVERSGGVEELDEREGRAHVGKDPEVERLERFEPECFNFCVDPVHVPLPL